MRSTGNSRPRSRCSKPPSKDRKRSILPYLTSSTGALLGETLAPRHPRRAVDVAETALGVARASGHRAMEAELLRVKASALLSLDAEAAELPGRRPMSLREKLGLGPEQGHGLRTLGDIMAARGDAMKAESSTALRAPNFEVSA